MTKPRGRPRAYDPDEALEAALEVFWTKGFAATSLHDLRHATGMNRPSLYAAFGDKKAIYRRVLQRFRDRMWATVSPVLRDAPDIEAGLTGYYLAMLQHYFSGDTGARGCLAFSTAAVEAAGDPDVRADLGRILAETDEMFTRWFERAIRDGELPKTVDASQLAWLATAVQHSLSLRARSGEDRAVLEARARAAAAQVLRTVTDGGADGGG